MTTATRIGVGYEQYKAVYIKYLWGITFLKIAHPTESLRELLEIRSRLARRGIDLAGQCANVLGSHIRRGGDNENMSTNILLKDEKYYIEKVQLPPHEVERLTGVDKRKLRYWTQKNYLESKSEDGYRYGFRGVRKAALMNRYISGGLSLEAAAGRAEKTLNEAETNRGKGETELSGEELEALPYKAFKNLELEELRETFKEVAKSAIKSPEIQRVIFENMKAELNSNGDDHGEE